VSEASAISDGELILRHVPRDPDLRTGAHVQRITSANFQLRKSETGVSVTRWSITSPRQLLSQLAALPKSRVTADSRVIAAKVGTIRSLGFRVEAAPTESDLGHAEIRSGTADLKSRGMRRRLKQLFRFVDFSQYDCLQAEKPETR